MAPVAVSYFVVTCVFYSVQLRSGITLLAAIRNDMPSTMAILFSFRMIILRKPWVTSLDLSLLFWLNKVCLLLMCMPIHHYHHHHHHLFVQTDKHINMVIWHYSSWTGQQGTKRTNSWPTYAVIIKHASWHSKTMHKRKHITLLIADKILK